ncbi:cytochrome P450 [Nocardia aobensis]|uniref:Cytochrome P450 n=1 Tax=Nocardia aobensis TaxID=257277 RepID=A0ABW6PDS6_9NOCA
MQAVDAMPRIMAAIYRWTGRNSYSDPFEAPSIVALEGTELATARGLMRTRLSRRGVAELRSEMERLADTLCKDLVALPGGVPVDLVEHYGRRFSQEILALLFDLKPGAAADACERAERMNKLLDLGLTHSDLAALATDARAVDRWADRHIDHIDMTPRSVIAPAVEAMRAGRLQHEQVRRMVNLLLVAGYTTTISVLMTGIKLLIEHPDQLALLRHQPELWANATEEVLRVADPVMVIPRWSTESGELDSVCVRENRPLYVTGVNADPEQFDSPHEFDIRRSNASTHFAFGGGAHLCLGATLARAEIETALRVFFSHFALPVLLDSVPGNSKTVRKWDRLVVELGETHR